MVVDDWSSIAPAAVPTADNVRRADVLHPLDFYRGRDFAGRYLFSLIADNDCRELPDPPKLNGIDVVLERVGADGARLLLTLSDQKNFEIFRDLCGHLLRATERLGRGANASGLRLVLRRLADWHEMMRRRRDDLLSVREQIGLIGELLFLKDIMLPRSLPAAAVASWRGGYGDEQDFVVGNWQFEVKTQSSTADQRFLISSEAQLDTGTSNLILCYQRIAASPARSDSLTLNGLVLDLSEKFLSAGAGTGETFNEGLDAWGYGPRVEYDQPEWMLIDRKFFEVRDGFPRIVPAILPLGVQNVSYEVVVHACEPFAIDVEDTLERVFK